jgi:hypothetical protein
MQREIACVDDLRARSAGKLRERLDAGEQRLGERRGRGEKADAGAFTESSANVETNWEPRNGANSRRVRGPCTTFSGACGSMEIRSGSRTEKVERLRTCPESSRTSTVECTAG